MTIVAAIRGMLSAGLTIEQALTAAELMEAASQPSGRSSAAVRQARYRERKAQKASRVTSRDVTPTPLAPAPILFEADELRRHHWPNDFKEQFWRLYPKRVDKRAAMEALAVVRRADKVAWQDVTDGVERLKAFVEPKFHPYPAKWLKNERWADEHQPEALRAPSFADLANGFDAQINGDRPNFQSPRPRRKSLIDGLNEVMEMIPDDE